MALRLFVKGQLIELVTGSKPENTKNDQGRWVKTGEMLDTATARVLSLEAASVIDIEATRDEARAMSNALAGMQGLEVSIVVEANSTSGDPRLRYVKAIGPPVTERKA
jgi:hypothetical protein